MRARTRPVPFRQLMVSCAAVSLAVIVIVSAAAGYDEDSLFGPSSGPAQFALNDNDDADVAPDTQPEIPQTVALVASAEQSTYVSSHHAVASASIQARLARLRRPSESRGPPLARDQRASTSIGRSCPCNVSRRPCPPVSLSRNRVVCHGVDVAVPLRVGPPIESPWR
jgi:hypothetical protein